MKLILMVGVPGSGKSTKAAKIAANLGAIIISTDSIFISDSTYLFVPEFIGAAHKINQAKVKVAMQRRYNIVVDNTNLQEWERKPYLDLAAEFDYEVELVEPDTPWKNDAAECFKRCTHGVPLDCIERMLAKLSI